MAALKELRRLMARCPRDGTLIDSGLESEGGRLPQDGGTVSVFCRNCGERLRVPVAELVPESDS